MINIYYRDSEGSYVQISTDDDTSSMLTTIHDGNRITTRTIQLYARNDDALVWYSNIRILPVDLVDANPYGDVGYNETGWGVKLSSNELELTESEWEDINWGEEISIENIGSDLSADTATYFPFWYLISSPPNIDAQNKTDIVLRVSYTENAVI